MTEIVIHGLSFSPYVRAVAMALEMKGLAYRHQAIALRPDPAGLGSPAHLVLHPFGRVPIVDDDGFRIYETQAILRYLDARYPQTPLQPTEPRAIGRMSQAIGVLDCYLFTRSVRPIGAERVVKPALFGMTGDDAVVAAALPETLVSFAALDDLLGENPYLAGDAVSMADLMLAPQLHMLAGAPEVRAMLNGMRLAAWLERMLAHPAMVATPPTELKLPARLRPLMAA